MLHGSEVATESFRRCGWKAQQADSSRQLISTAYQQRKQKRAQADNFKFPVDLGISGASAK